MLCGEACHHIHITLPKSLSILNGGKHHRKRQQAVHPSERRSGEALTFPEELGAGRAAQRAAAAATGLGCSGEGERWGVLPRSRLNGWRAAGELATAFEMNRSIFLKNAHERATNMEKV